MGYQTIEGPFGLHDRDPPGMNFDFGKRFPQRCVYRM
jgi:hypothetical protein